MLCYGHHVKSRTEEGETSAVPSVTLGGRRGTVATVYTCVASWHPVIRDGTQI